MELYEKLLVKTLEIGRIEIKFSEDSLVALIESESYRLLQKIYKIISNDNITDEDCFEAIEEIMRVFEDIGADCGCRHDF